MHGFTPTKRVLFVYSLKLGLAGLFIACSILFGIGLFKPSIADATTSNTVNFQARLMNASGSIAPDGNYNVEFKLYNSSSSSGSSQGSCTGDSSCLWFEDYTYNSGSGGTDARIHVVNGFLTVSLGSINPFSNATNPINWGQPLYLTMNVGGTVGSGTITWDGEMSPRLSLTAVPSAFSLQSPNSGSFTSTLTFQQPTANEQITLPAESGATEIVCYQSDTACGFESTSGTDFIKNSSSQQAGANFNISGTGQLATLDATGSGSANTLSIGSSASVTGAINIGASETTGTLTLGATGQTGNIVLGRYNGNGTSTISIGSNAGSTTTQNVNIATSTTGTNTVTIGSTSSTSTATIQGGATSEIIQNSGATIETSTNSSTALIVQSSNGNDVLTVNTTTANLITNSSFESGKSGWAVKGSATISQVTAPVFDGVDSLQVGTTAAIGDGAKYAVSLASTTTYSFSVYARALTTNFSTFEIGRSENGSADTSCATAQTVQAGQWNRYSCTFTTGTTSGSTYIYVKQTDATSRTFYIDGVELVASSSNGVYDGSRVNVSGSLVVGAGSQAANAGTTTLIRGTGETNSNDIPLAVQTAGGTNLLTVNAATGNTNVSGDIFNTFWGTAALTATSNSGAGSQILAVSNDNGNTLINTTSNLSNLVLTSSFVPAPGSGNPTANWTAKGTATLTADSANAYVGVASAKAVVTAASSGMQTQISPTSGLGTILPNTDYQLTFWAKCSNGMSTFTYGRQDVSGTDVNSTTTGTCSTNWQQYTAHWTTGATITNPNIYMDSGATSSVTIWVDGIQLIQTTTNAATSYNPGNIYLQGVIAGATTFQNTNNSTTALQIQNSSGVSLLTADTTNAQLKVTGNLNVGTGAAGAGRLFSDGFESGNFTLWNGGAGGTIATETTTVHDGKYAAEVGPLSSSSGSVTTSITGSSTVYARSYIDVSSQGGGSNLDLLSLTDGTHNWSVYRNATDNKLYVFGWNGTTSTNIGNETTASTSLGNWYDIEWRMTMGASGTTQVWVNGTQVLSVTGVNFGATNLNSFTLGEGNNRTGTIYFDDVAVDTAFNGESASLNVADSLHISGTSSFGNDLLVQPMSDSTAAFQVQNASGTQVLTVDTAGKHVIVGSAGTCAGSGGGQFCINQTSASGSVNENNTQVISSGGAATSDTNFISMSDFDGTTANTDNLIYADASGTTNTAATVNTITGKVAASQPGNFLTFTNGTTTALQFSNAGVLTIEGGQTQDVNTLVSSGAGASLALQPGASTGASSNGANTTIKGGNGSGTTAVTGGTLTLQGGSATGGSGTLNGGSVNIDAGTGLTNNGQVLIGSNVDSVVTIGNPTGTRTLTLGSSSATQSVVIANGAGAPTVSIANASTAGATINIAGAANASTNTINIANGASAATTNVNILSGVGTAGASTLKLADNTRVNRIDLGDINPAAARSINIGNDTGTANAAVDTINIGTNPTTVAGGNTVHIADGTPTGSGTNLVTIGSLANASSTTIQAGTGNINLNSASQVDIQPATDNANAFRVNNTQQSTPILRVDTLNNVAVVGNSSQASQVQSQSTDSVPNATTKSLTFTPSATGDVIVLAVNFASASAFSVSSVSQTGGGVSWQTSAAATKTDSTGFTAPGKRVEIWYGTVTGTSGTAISVTFSGTDNVNTEIVAEEFSTPLGSGTKWSLTTAGTDANDTASTSVTYPSLTSSHSGELYWGYNADSATPLATGSAGGLTSTTYEVTGNNNAIAYGINNTSGSSSQPVQNTASGVSAGAAIMLTALPSTTLTVRGNEQIGGDTSTSALVVQDALAAKVLTVNTSTDEVIIGAGSSGESTPKVLELDSGTSSSDPGTEADGAMYYNNNMNSFRCGQNGKWVACDGLTFAEKASTTAITNATAGTPTDMGNYTIPASDCQPGVTYLINAGGHLTQGAAGDLFRFYVYENGTANAISQTTGMGVNSTSGASWTLSSQVTCVTTTTVITNGTVFETLTTGNGNVGNGQTESIGVLNSGGSTKTWSASSTSFGVMGNWLSTNNSAGDTLTLDFLSIQRLGP